MNQELQILIKSKELFFKLGVRSITMDDISSELGISKKTLYQYVNNKSDLVNKTLLLHFADEKLVISDVIGNAENAMDEIIRIARASLKQFRSMHPSTIYDIKKYYPEAWKLIDQFKSDFIYCCIKENILKGKAEGMYRMKIDEDVIARLYINSIDYLVNPHNFPAVQYNFSDLYKEFINYHLQGISAERGYLYLKNIQLEENE
ncbi:MAG: TetR/AcrR family transcriptional regulator [Chitinophagales bacterium]|jgi:AcrR family transcriptional regulator|nr:TetR/AcrR family transcriptional regulator [Chitinophagales bacterium]|tara:strand:+ start:141 stop:752 length:612 start_codon:yes stop_codon:yes gene_type:complete